MKRYILISVVERNICVTLFSTLKETQNAMRDEFAKSGGDKDSIDDGMSEINDTSAWVTDGNNHDNYDWLIAEI